MVCWPASRGVAFMCCSRHLVSVTPVAEVVHAPPAVHPTGGTSLQAAIVLGPHSHVVPSSVVCSRDLASLPADFFGSLDDDMDLGGDAMAPLEHHLASGPSSSPHPSLDMTRATSGKCLVMHDTLPQVHPPPKHVGQVPGMAGSANAPILFGWPHSRSC